MSDVFPTLELSQNAISSAAHLGCKMIREQSDSERSGVGVSIKPRNVPAVAENDDLEQRPPTHC